MTIHVIAAVSSNNIIGDKGQIPWVIPEDLKRFRSKTIGHNIIMGRKTFDSLGRTPLSGRHNIVITRNPKLLKLESPKGHKNLEFTEEYLKLIDIAKTSKEQFWVIGGSVIYAAFLPFATTLSLTRVNEVVQGDTEFPRWDLGFKRVSNITHSSNGIVYDFNEYTI